MESPCGPDRTTGAGADGGHAPWLQRDGAAAAGDPEGRPEEKHGAGEGGHGAARHQTAGRHHRPRRYGALRDTPRFSVCVCTLMHVYYIRLAFFYYIGSRIPYRGAGWPSLLVKRS